MNGLNIDTIQFHCRVIKSREIPEVGLDFAKCFDGANLLPDSKLFPTNHEAKAN